MYILHFVLLNFSGIASRHASINKNILLIVLFLSTVLVAFFLALISEKYIEKPFIEMGKKIIQKL
jgi:peptidoglycan/LPS O-acetylase OafA/YrhL